MGAAEIARCNAVRLSVAYQSKDAMASDQPANESAAEPTANLTSGNPDSAHGPFSGSGDASSRGSKSTNRTPRSFQERPTLGYSALPEGVPQGITRYKNLNELGRGGWGFVVQAHDAQLDRQVAVKRINGDIAGNSDISSRFLHEAKVTSQLQHPGIVPVHELGVAEDGAPYYVMKLLEGKTFRELINGVHRAKEKPLGGFSVELLNRFVDVCNAVGYAHERRIVHRDLKPSNIMVGNFGETIVVDWGLAKRLDSETDPVMESDEQTLPVASYANSGTLFTEVDEEDPLPDEVTLDGGSRMTPAGSHIDSGTGDLPLGGTTAPDGTNTRYGAVLGTPSYMSPEQSEGRLEAIAPATDIYALGVILYEVLTGKNPFRSGDVQTTLKRVKKGEYKPARAVNKQVPRPLAAICRKAMAYKPENRYHTAAEIVDDIQRFIAGEAVSTYQENLYEKSLRWCRRNKSLAASFLVSGVLLTIASVVFGIVIQRAYYAEQQARAAAEQAHRLALDNLSEARQAGDAWLVELSGSLQYFPGMDSLRSKLLNQAVDHYAGLVANQQQSDAPKTPAAALEDAKLHIRLGDLHRLLGAETEAAKNYATAETALAAAAAEVEDKSQAVGTDDLRARIHLEQINTRIGDSLLAASDQVAEDAPSTIAIDKDRQWLENYLEQHPENGQAHSSQAKNTLARLLIAESRGQGVDREQQIDLLTDAAKAGRSLVEVRGEERDHQLLSTIQDELVRALRLEGRLFDATQVLQEQAQRLTKLIETHPSRPDLLQSRAVVKMKLAGISAQIGQSTAAAEGYEDAVSDFDLAWQLTDADAFYQSNVAVSEANLGRVASQWLPLDGSAEQHLRVAIAHLQQTVADEGITTGNLVRLAECHESLGSLARRHGDPDALEHYDTANQCYTILNDNTQLTADVLARWAALLAARCELHLSGEQLELAEADSERARQLFDQASANRADMPAGEQAQLDRFEAYLLDVESQVQAAANDDQSKATREQSLEKLREAATAEREERTSDAYPIAMQSLVDRLIDSETADEESISQAANWLQAMREVYPICEQAADWHQRHAMVSLLQDDLDEARTAIDRAIKLNPHNQLSEVVSLLISAKQGEQIDPSETEKLSKLAEQLPGDERLQFWLGKFPDDK